MRTTNKAFTTQVREHILSNLDDTYVQEPAAQLQAVVDAFKNWWGVYEQKRNPNRWDAMIDWLNGLPSEIRIEYTYHSIHETMKKWFETCGQTYRYQCGDAMEIKLYHSFFVREFLQLCKQYKVDAYI